jgi:hypothetical protein
MLLAKIYVSFLSYHQNCDPSLLNNFLWEKNSNFSTTKIRFPIQKFILSVIHRLHLIWVEGLPLVTLDLSSAVWEPLVIWNHWAGEMFLVQSEMCSKYKADFECWILSNKIYPTSNFCKCWNDLKCGCIK